MKIVSWNVNGIRSVFKSNFRDWLIAESPDILCLQETKADESSLTNEITQIDGYYSFFHSSSLKKGHSGVAVYSKVKPISVEKKLGIRRFDDEGRCLKLTFDDFVLFNFYIPNGGRSQGEIPYKLDVYKQLFPLLKTLSDKETILAGDFNIAHTELCLHLPRENKSGSFSISATLTVSETGTPTKRPTLGGRMPTTPDKMTLVGESITFLSVNRWKN